MAEIALFPLNNKVPEHFFERLRQLRAVRGLTQAELAERAGMHQGAIAHFECGGRLPSFENIRLLSCALSCTADYLLGMSSSPAESHEDPAFKMYYHLSAVDQEYIGIMIDALLARASGRSQ